MKLSIAIVAVLVAACQASGEFSTQDDHGDDGGIDVPGTRNCKPKIPYLKKLKQKEFAGLWYLDSSTVSAWAHSTCLAHLFIWYPKTFAHDHQHYRGYWRYFVRRGSACYKQCSFARGGYLHGWETNTDQADCNFGSDNATTMRNVVDNEPESGVDPCHPHYSSKWDMYVLKTDYKRYAVMWLCDAGAAKYALIFSRTKTNLPEKLRNELYHFLKEHGFNKKLKETHNTGC